MVCFWNIDHGHRRAEIGYELNPDCWHKGLMTEALTSIIDHGFQKLGFHRIEATPLVINEASQRLLERCGFRKEGVLRHRMLFQDRFLAEAY
jgi:ribosomal-protein-alanine N-acetyltransferase